MRVKTYRTGQIIELSILNKKTISSLKRGGVLPFDSTQDKLSSAELAF